MRSPKRAVVLLVLLAGCRAANDSQTQAKLDTMTKTSSAARPAADTASTGVKACELISADDVKQVTGITFEQGVTTNDYGGDSQCRFPERSDTTHALMVTLHDHGKLTAYQNVPGSSVIGGLGDEAVWHGGNRQLAVRRGDAVFSISFLQDPANKQWAIKLARIALAKL